MQVGLMGKYKDFSGVFPCYIFNNNNNNNYDNVYGAVIMT